MNLLTKKNRANKTGAEAQKKLARGRQSMDISLVGPVYPYRGGIAHHTAGLGCQVLQKTPGCLYSESLVIFGLPNSSYE